MQDYTIILFDLDGTLTNSHDGITNAVRYALNKMNLPIPDEAGLRKYIGPPLVDSFQRYAGMDAAAAERGEDLRQRRQPVLQLMPDTKKRIDQRKRLFIYRMSSISQITNCFFHSGICHLSYVPLFYDF